MTKKILFILVAVILVALPLTTEASTSEDGSIYIAASPKALIFQGEGDQVIITVHTNVSYSSVAAGSVQLDTGISILPASYTYADDRGNLVAKFYGIKYSNLLVEDKQVNLILNGVYDNGETFSGLDTIYVVLKDVDSGGPKPGPGSGESEN